MCSFRFTFLFVLAVKSHGTCDNDEIAPVVLLQQQVHLREEAVQLAESNALRTRHIPAEDHSPETFETAISQESIEQVECADCVDGALMGGADVAEFWFLGPVIVSVSDSIPSERDATLIVGSFVVGLVVTIFILTVAMRTCASEDNSNTEAPAKEAPGRSVFSASPGDIDHDYDESFDSFWPRTFVLIIMLMVQSASAVILFSFRSLVIKHPEITFFLTMLVGLGGNASGQSMVLAVRKIAFGRDVQLIRQLHVGLGMGIILAPVAYVRAYASDQNGQMVAVVIGVSVVFITTAGTVIGTVLPKLIEAMAIDPVHTSPVVVQVVMDIVGTTIVCVTGSVFLDLA